MNLTEPVIGAIIAALARVGGLVATAPVIGDQGVPARAKLTFVLAVSVAIGVNRPEVPFSELPMTAALELGIGMLTGITARFAMTRIAVAGQLMGLSLGLGFAAQYDIHAGESAGVLRTLLTTIASIAFLAAGGLEAVVRGAAASPARLSQVATLGPALLHHATASVAYGLSLAAPVMVASLAGNVALAVMNRAAPAVNVFSVALSAVMILGGVVLLATAAHMVAGMTDTAHAAVDVLTG